MFSRIKIWIKDKFSQTVFGEASRMLHKLYSKNAIAFALEMGAVFFGSIYLAGFASVFVINFASGEDYEYTIRNIMAAWLHGGFIWSVFIFALVQILIFRVIAIFRTDYIRDERGYDISVEHTYGNADFMTPERMREVYIVAPIEQNKATIFGRDPKNHRLLVSQKHPQLSINRNVFIVAGPSAGKSATFIIPLLLQIIRRGESAIISDPKSELYKIVGELAKHLGYEVRLLELNPMFIGHSDPCNFLAYVGDDADKAQVVANAIINTTTSTADMQDFWTEGALNLLQAIILRICTGDEYPEEDKNLPELFTYITTHDMSQMDQDFAGLPDSHIAKAPYKIFQDGEDRVRGQVIQGLGIKLKLFNSPMLRKILSETTGGIDILNPGRKKCLYFVGSNDQDSSLDSIVSLFYTLEYQELVRYADARPDLELPITVHMVLDEYANMAAIPDFQKKLSTVRSRGIVTYIVTQDINQLATKHPNDTWRTVLNDCDYFMLLKTSDQKTMEWWSMLSGEQTKTVKNKQYNRAKTDILGIHAEERINQGQGQGTVLTKHQVRTLKAGELYLLMAKEDMVKLDTFFWKDHPYAKYITDDVEILPARHCPLWWLQENGIVGPYFQYDKRPSIVQDIKVDEELAIDTDYDPDKMLGVAQTPDNIIRTKLNRAKKELKKKKAEKPKEEQHNPIIQIWTLNEKNEVIAPDGRRVSKKALGFEPPSKKGETGSPSQKKPVRTKPAVPQSTLKNTESDKPRSKRSADNRQRKEPVLDKHLGEVDISKITGETAVGSKALETAEEL